MAAQGKPTTGQMAMALGVHLFTGLGTAIGLFMVFAAFQGEIVLFFWLGVIGLMIDAVDGTFARVARVKEVTPWFDGEMLDNIIDYNTYVFAPMVLLYVNGYLPAGWLGAVFAAIPMIASGYQFCRTDAKTDDHFFLGFPSYWNFLAFYVVIFGLTPWATVALIVVCAVLVFIPIGYLYPSRMLRFQRLTLALSVAYGVSYMAILALLPNPPAWLVYGSLLYIVYYLAMSLYLWGLRQRGQLVTQSQTPFR
jgi:phosphatidylcholine synthase